MENLKKITTSAIAAIQEKDRGLGFEDKLQYHIPEDLERFHETTNDHVIIVGRTTFESMQKYKVDMEKRWPDIIVITSAKILDKQPANVTLVKDERQALVLAKEAALRAGDDEIFIIGGQGVYESLLPETDRLYLTEIKGDKPADRHFPSFEDFTKEIVREEKTHTGKDGEEIKYAFVTRER